MESGIRETPPPPVLGADGLGGAVYPGRIARISRDTVE